MMTRYLWAGVAVTAAVGALWGARAEATLGAGAKTGIGSCSASGPGGWTGCWAQQMRAARAEKAAAAKENNPDIDE